MGRGLYDACAGGSLAAVRALVGQGVDVRAVDEWGRSVLHVAAEHGPQELLEYLVKQGASVTAVDQFGESVLHVAVRRGDLSIIEFLLDHGVEKAPLVRCPHLQRKFGSAHVQQKFDNCPEDVLVLATRHASLEVVEFLVKKGFAVDPANRHQSPLLSAAISRADVSLVDYFAQRGVDMFATDSFGTSMMCLAAKLGGLKVFEYFVEKGVCEDGGLLLRAAVEGDQLDTVKLLASMRLNLHYVNPKRENLLHVAVEKASVAMIEYLLGKQVDAHCVSVIGRTLLHVAAERGNMEILEALLNFGLSVKEIQTTDWLMQLAVRGNNPRVVEAFLNHGLKFPAMTSNELTLFHEAILRDNRRMVELLIAKGLDLKPCDQVEPALLRVAVEHGSLSLIKFLVEHGLELEQANQRQAFLMIEEDGQCIVEDEYVDDFSSVDSNDSGKDVPGGHFSLLHVAVQRGDRTVVEYLLAQGLSPDCQDKIGRNPLHIAADGPRELIQLLIRHGVSVDHRDKRDETPLHCAVRSGKIENVETFVNAGAVISNTYESLLAIAAKRGYVDVMKFILQQGISVKSNVEQDRLLKFAVASGSRDMLKLLLENGVDTRALREAGEILHIAVAQEDVEMIDHLIRKGLDISATNAGGDTVLHTLLRRLAPPFDVNVDLIKYLCTKGVNVCSVGKYGDTSVHIACHKSSIDVVSILISYGAKGVLNLKNTYGLTPLHVAAREWNAPLVELLLDAGAHIHIKTQDGCSPLACTLLSLLRISETTVRLLYRTIRLLCSRGSVWDKSIDAMFINWSQAAQSGLPREWPKDSFLGSFLSDPTEVSRDSSFLEPVSPRAISVRRGLFVCAQHWEQERNNGRTLSEIPYEIIWRGETAVSSYLEAIERSGAAQLVYRSKVCVAGPTMAGKTSLIRSLVSMKPELTAVGDRTIGIDLYSKAFVEESSQNVGCFNITYWDFGGQDIYQTVQPLFFSRQTLYIFCLDLEAYNQALKGELNSRNSGRANEVRLRQYFDRNVLKWMRLIFSRQPDAEILLVATKADKISEVTDLNHIRNDLQLRLNMWRRKLHLEVDAASGHRPLQFQLAGSSVNVSLLLETMKQQVDRLLKKEWILVSVVEEDGVQAAWEAIRANVVAHASSFVMPLTYSRVLELILKRRDEAAHLLNGKERIEGLVIPVDVLCKILLEEVEGSTVDECLTILHTLQDLGDILWYEDSTTGPLQDMVILDPVLVIDIVREVVNHEEVGDMEAIRKDGRIPHDVLVKTHLWKDMDRELVYAFKLLLQHYQIAYASDSKVMDWDADLIAPSYWKARDDPPPPSPLVQNPPSTQRYGVVSSFQLCWEYDLPSEIAEPLFEQFAVESYTPMLERSMWRSCIESFLSGRFASRLEMLRGDTRVAILRIEIAAETEIAGWRYMRFYVMAMETVLERYPGLLVSRYLVERGSSSETRRRIKLVTKVLEDSARMGQTSEDVLRSMPWLPPDFDWFIESAWREPGLLQRLRMRDLVQQSVSKLDVLGKLIVTGEKARRFPALWTVDYAEKKRRLKLKMYSDLSGVCFHTPIKITVQPKFIAKYGRWLRHGFSLIANVVPQLLSLGVLQKVMETALPVIDRQVEHAVQIHNLVAKLEVVNVRFSSGGTKMSPGMAMTMLRDLLQLHDPTFEELKIADVANLQCAATPDGHYVWAHRHEILELKGTLELCDPGSIRHSASQPPQPPAIPLRLRILFTKGLIPWHWRRAFCEWRLYYVDSNATPVASGRTAPHNNPTSEPSWHDAVFDLSCIRSIEMLRQCRLKIYVKRPSRLLGTTKFVDAGAVAIKDFLGKDAHINFTCTTIVVPLGASARSVTCQLTA